MPRTKSGFTLIELLVALVLMSILAVMINAVVANCVDAVSSVRTAENEREKIQALDRLLGLALREAQNISLTSTEKAEAIDAGEYENDEGTLRFTMAPDRVGFCLARPFTRQPEGRMYWIEIIAVSDEKEVGETKLIMTETAYLRGAQEPLGFDEEEAEKLETREVVLLDKLRLAEFKFWYLSEEQSTAADTESFPEYEEDEDMDEEGYTFSLGFPDYLTLRIIFASGREVTLKFWPNYQQQIKL